MSKTMRYGLLALGGVLLILLVGLLFPSKPPPPRSDYYTGPIASKTRPGVFVMPDGKIVPPPAGYKPSKIPLRQRSGDL